MSTFLLEVVTPEKRFFKAEVDMVIVRCIEGDLGILKGHCPLVSLLGIGKLIIKQNGKAQEAALAGGYVEINKEKVLIMCDSVEWPRDIDLERAKSAKARAESRLKDPKGIDITRAEIALKKSINRIHLSDNF